MKDTWLLRIALIFFVFCVIVSCVLAGTAVFKIHKSVQKYCAIAQEAHPHPGDNVAALIDYMNSQQHSLEERNKAVWALGRLRAVEALPAMEALYTGQPCEHEKYLCQYELAKAIKRCGGTPDPPYQSKH